MVTSLAIARKPSEQVERRLVAEWVRATYPGRPVFLNARLGAGQPAFEESGRSWEEWVVSVGMFRRFVDAVIIDGDTVLLVEAKLVSHPTALGEIELYAHLFPSTPEFSDYRALHVQPVLLYAIDDPAVSYLARLKGWRTVAFNPPWVADYLATKAERHRVGKRKDASLS